MSYVGPDGCTHTRPSKKTGTGKSAKVEVQDDWTVSCGPCESSLAGHELWGSGDEPAPLTRDELRQLEAQQQDSNRAMLQSISSIPGMIDVLNQLVQQTKPAAVAKK